ERTGRGGTGSALAGDVPEPRSLLLLAVVVLPVAVSGCGDDQPYSMEPAPGKPSFAVRIAPSENLTSIETDEKSPNGERLRVSCETCHARVDVGEPPDSPDELV